MASDIREYKYEEVINLVSNLIDSGALQYGDKAPSLRSFSEKLGLSISTVMKAYMELEMMGFLEVRPQSGFYVTDIVTKNIPKPAISNPSIVPVKVNKFELHKSFLSAMTNPDIVPLNAAVPSKELMPHKMFSRILKKITTDESSNFMTYETLQGFPDLRRQIAYFLIDSSIRASADDIIITLSATEALNVVMRTLTKPGDLVIVESPTHFGYIPLFESLGIYALEIPTDFSTGIDIGALKKALKKYTIATCILQPNFSNPTGALYPDEKKEEVVRLFTKYDISIIEDDIFANLPHQGRRPKSLMAYDKSGIVVHVSSFSKTIAPMGPGWICSKLYTDRFMNTKLSTSLDNPKLIQEAFTEYLASGSFNRHISRIRTSFKRQVATFSSHIRASFPIDIKMTQPKGSFMLWVELPEQINTRTLYVEALEYNIAFAPGAIFTTQDKYDNCLRINCGHPWDDRIANAIQVLGDLIKNRI